MENIDRRPSSSIVDAPQSYELTATNGRPVRVIGSEVGELVTQEGTHIRVYRTVSGRRVLHRTIDNCWGGYGDVIVLEGLDDDRLKELLGYGPGALEIYERLGVDPVTVLE